MQKFVIEGGQKPSGEIRVAGAKNHVLKAFAAALLCDDVVEIRRVPDIEDVNHVGLLIEQLGGSAERVEDDVWRVDPRGIDTYQMDRGLAEKVRMSVLFIGPLLARFGKVVLPHPGGDVIGKRPIDFHLEGYEAMGADVKVLDDRYELSAPGGLEGGDYVFEIPSHTGTENLMIGAALAKGRTTIHYAAQDPEVVALAENLNSVGAKISGAGTHTIVIEGVDSLRGGTWTGIPDRIEVATFAMLSAITDSPLRITGCEPGHLEVVWKIFEKIGVEVERGADEVVVRPSGELLAYNLRTREYPGFLTDYQAPFTVLMTQAKGLSLIHEAIFEGRLFYVDYLNRMGADIIMCDPHRVLVNGPTRLRGRHLESPDIRAGMAMVLAALVAEGTSEIDNVYHIDRGYEHIEDRLRGIGLDIRREESA